jgi:hypothetical protein
MKLESKSRFLDWCIDNRFFDTLTAGELLAYGREGKLPTALRNRASTLDGRDQDVLLKLWKKEEQLYRGRSEEELQYFSENASWPEQRLRFEYSLRDGCVVIRWLTPTAKDGFAPEKQQS